MFGGLRGNVWKMTKLRRKKIKTPKWIMKENIMTLSKADFISYKEQQELSLKSAKMAVWANEKLLKVIEEEIKKRKK